MLEEYRVGNLREDEVQSQQKIMKEKSIDDDAHDSSRPAIKSRGFHVPLCRQQA